MNQSGSAISDYYNGKTIFITGASGFIGKVLIWKLLQSCSSLDTIFILMRHKKGKNIDSRVTELFQVPIFENFKKENPQILNKVKAIGGDISEDNLGISKEDERKLVNSVHIIFHIAAIVKFNADLKDAVNLNVQGTQRMLELATRMPKLEALVHVSTAFCHSDVDELEEKPYPTRETPQEIIDLVRWMKPELLKSINNELIKPHPNTYTYSKRLAENLVADYYPKLPIAIVRPSIVGPAICEPMTGWVDNLNGVIGTLIAAGKGVLRVFWCDKECYTDAMPVDILCNSGLIAVAWKMGKDKSRNRKDFPIPVYNVCAERFPGTMTYNEMREYWKKYCIDKYPFSLVLWYPTLSLQKNFYIYITMITFLQWIPACLIDALLYAFGYETIMIRIQRRIYDGVKALNYFATRKWKFVKRNIPQIRDELSAKDTEIFGMPDVDNVKKYFIQIANISRWYLMKEDPSNLPTARRRLKL